jgi:hypothetical protein
MPYRHFRLDWLCHSVHLLLLLAAHQ